MVTSEGLDDVVKIAEERRKSAETVLWQLPAVSIAAQAFLLGVGLKADTDPWARNWAGWLGVAAVLTTGAVVAFQAVRMSVIGRWIELELGRKLDEKELAEELDTRDGRKLNAAQWFLLRRLPTPFWFWGVTLAAFLVADIKVLTKAG
jgi:hypothetical protein